MAQSKLPRGESLCNPGNIRISDTHWLGKVYPSRDKEFETFDTPENGIRATAKILLDYYHVHKLDTIRQIINRWAPPSENDTASYIADVSAKMLMSRDHEIVLTEPQTLFLLVRAIITHEQGRCIYSTAQIMEGIDKALDI